MAKPISNPIINITERTLAATVTVKNIIAMPGMGKGCCWKKTA